MTLYIDIGLSVHWHSIIRWSFRFMDVLSSRCTPNAIIITMAMALVMGLVVEFRSLVFRVMDSLGFRMWFRIPHYRISRIAVIQYVPNPMIRQILNSLISNITLYYKSWINPIIPINPPPNRRYRSRRWKTNELLVFRIWTRLKTDDVDWSWTLFNFWNRLRFWCHILNLANLVWSLCELFFCSSIWMTSDLRIYCSVCSCVSVCGQWCFDILSISKRTVLPNSSKRKGDIAIYNNAHCSYRMI